MISNDLSLKEFGIELKSRKTLFFISLVLNTPFSFKSSNTFIRLLYSLYLGIISCQNSTLNDWGKHHMSRYRILVVEDEQAIRDLIKDIFTEIDFNVSVATNGDEALELLRRESYDLVTLDVNMPGLDGFTVLRRLREFTNVPVMILSVRQGEADRIEAIQYSADDYITKPFKIETLIEHAQVLLRRGPWGVAIKESLFDDDHLKINFDQRQVFVYEKEIKLAPKEYDLLHELVINSPNVLTYDRLLGDIWGPEYKDNKHLLHDHINHLRKAIEPDAHNPQYIINIHKVGYRFNHVQ
jgi:two-component system, OmpR family, KDP operon response regulator KdpE